MKISRILPVVGILILLACSAAFSQSPSQIPPGAGVGVDRQPPGSRFRNPTNPPQAAAQPSATSPDKRAISQSCSQQADAKGLHGKARKAFRSQCMRSGGR
jgi:psiF repeat